MQQLCVYQGCIWFLSSEQPFTVKSVSCIILLCKTVLGYHLDGGAASVNIITMLCVFLKVAQRAGEIAKELGLMTQAEQGDASQTNSTGGNWINLNLFNRNGTDASNSSWYSSDGSQDQSAVEAALLKYQLVTTDEDNTDSTATPVGPSTPVPTLVNHTRLHTRHGSENDLERTRQQTRAERAGHKPVA